MPGCLLLYLFKQKTEKVVVQITTDIFPGLCRVLLWRAALRDLDHLLTVRDFLLLAQSGIHPPMTS
jgi:hypothetical protein